MKIAILTPTLFAFSGIDRIVEQNTAEYVRKKNKVLVVAFRGNMQLPGVKIDYIGMPQQPLLERLYRLLFFIDFAKVWKTSSKLKDADIVISHQYPMNLIAWLAKKRFGCRYVYYDAGIADPELFGSLAERMYMRLFRFLTNLTARPADDAVSISRYLQQKLLKETALRSKLRYVQIDAKRFNRNIRNEKTVAVKKKYRLGRHVLLYVGRISPHKGIHVLLDAFKIVKRDVPDAQLVIVGKHTFGKYSQQLRQMAGKDVIFAGFVPDEELPYYYGAAALYVTASFWEGFDIPAVEAQACGKRVVAFDIGSHPEVIKKGTLVKEKTAAAVAAAIIGELKK